MSKPFKFCSKISFEIRYLKYRFSTRFNIHKKLMNKSYKSGTPTFYKRDIFASDRNLVEVKAKRMTCVPARHLLMCIPCCKGVLKQPEGSWV